MLYMLSHLYVEHKYKQEMSKSCRKSILCRPRRGRCFLGGAVFVVLHFRHLRIALSSSEALKGRLHQLPETLSESGPPFLFHEGRAPNSQVLRCLILLTTEYALHRIMSSDQCAQLPRAVWWPHLKREIYTLLS